MKTLLTMFLLCGTCGAAFAGCPVDRIEKALSTSLDGLQKVERQATDIRSTEGGVWRIYRGKDGRLDTLVRIDAGETGMNERRLSVVSPDAYGIAATRVDYLRHAFLSEGGPNGTAKRTTEYFYFCGGKLHLPPEQFATVGEGYAAAAAAAQKAMLDDKDVAALTRALKR